MSTTSDTTSSTTTLPIDPGSWTLDASHSGVLFQVRHLGLSNVRGRFQSFDASLVVGERLEDVQVTATVDLSSVDTNNADRDAHLRSTDFFDVETNPVMTFVSTGITGSGSDYELTGDLTINGVTKSVTFETEFHGTEVFPGDGQVHAGFDASATIKRSDFGVDFGIIPGEKLLLADKVKVELEIQFVAPAVAGA